MSNQTYTIHFVDNLLTVESDHLLPDPNAAYTGGWYDCHVCGEFRAPEALSLIQLDAHDHSMSWDGVNVDELPDTNLLRICTTCAPRSN